MSSKKPFILVLLAAFTGLVFVWLASTSAQEQEKRKGDKRDEKAKELAERFLKALNAKDLEAVMKVADVPFFFDEMETIKARDELKRKIESALESIPHLEYRFWTTSRVGSLEDWFIRDPDLKAMKAMLVKTDHIVLFEEGKRALAVAVTWQNEEAKVIGLRGGLPPLILALAIPEKAKDDKHALQARKTSEDFLRAVKNKDLDSLMKICDVPWNSDGNRIIKDRDALKKTFQSSLARGGELRLETARIIRYGEIRKLLWQPGREVGDLADDDWVVFLKGGPRDKGGILFLRVRDRKGKVIGTAE